MKIQILDYSTTQIAAPLFKSYLPGNLEISEHYISSKDSFTPVLEQTGITHVVHSGSALSINQPAPFMDSALEYIRTLTQQGVKQMGVCFGHQLICRALVGEHAVQASPNGLEAGWRDIEFRDSTTSIPGLTGTQTVWQHHFDEVTELPPGSELIATAEHTFIQAYINHQHSLIGMQFHPEFDQDSGNKYFLNDRQLLEKQGFDVESLTQGMPSGNHGNSVFDYFLSHF